MGNHSLGKQIGTLAQIAYERRLPGESAISILDRFCYHDGVGGDAEWEAEDPNRPGYCHPVIGNYTDPTPDAALGMLMVEAFAPNGLDDLQKYFGQLGYTPSDDREEDSKREAAASASSELWYEEVYKPFKTRYDFW
jgi:hypothetical protein